MKDFREQIHEGIVIGDGAMSTMLHQYGVPVRSCTEALCLTNPELVATVHHAYVEAGATLLQTHTFSAHRTGLSRYGYQGDLVAINQAAVRIAREAAGEKAYVFGTIGSIAGVLSQGIVLDEDRRETLRSEFAEQAEVLLEAGVDGLILETFPELDELLLALLTVRPLTYLPIVTNLAPITVGYTRDGFSIADAFLQLADAGADVVGLNCELGPSNILRTFEALPLLNDTPYAAVPNSGLLHVQDGEFSYTGGPDYFADVAQKLAELGVRVLGGCCGTTPEHIRKVAERLNGFVAVSRDDLATATPRVIHEPAPSKSSSNVDNSVSIVEMANRGRTVIVELDPPRTLHMSRYIKAAHALKDAGADMITLADNSLGSVRVSNMAVASLLRQEGIEPLVHVTCRDRNLIGQQSHLMGMHVLGVHNILLVTGDPTRYGDLPGATSVYDVSSTELSRMVKRLNDGIAFSGQALKSPSRFVIGTAFNPHVRNFDKAVERLKRKIEAGADFVMTQPVFDEDTILKIHRATVGLGVPMFVGLTPLTSERNAVFLHHEVPGIELPETVLKRMADVSPEEAPLEGLRIAKSLLDVALTCFQGIYLMTPFLRYELTAELVEYIRAFDGVSASVARTAKRPL